MYFQVNIVGGPGVPGVSGIAGIAVYIILISGRDSIAI